MSRIYDCNLFWGLPVQLIFVRFNFFFHSLSSIVQSSTEKCSTCCWSSPLSDPPKSFEAACFTSVDFLHFRPNPVHSQTLFFFQHHRETIWMSTHWLDYSTWLQVACLVKAIVPDIHVPHTKQWPWYWKKVSQTVPTNLHNLQQYLVKHYKGCYKRKWDNIFDILFYSADCEGFMMISNWCSVYFWSIITACLQEHVP